MGEVYIAGRGVASSLGIGLPATFQRLRALAAGDTTQQPTRMRLNDGSDCLYFPIADGSPLLLHDASYTTWKKRAHSLIDKVVAEACAEVGVQRDIPLILSSSSFDTGAIERVDKFKLDLIDNDFLQDIANHLDWRGQYWGISTGCTSSANALLNAMRLLQSESTGAVLVLGMEFYNQLSLGGFSAMQLLSPNHIQPLGAQRNGLILGEAIAAILLTNQLQRWQIKSGSSLVDGRDSTGIRAETVSTLCAQVFKSSGHGGAGSGEVDLIKLHASGNIASDAAEIDGLTDFFKTLPALCTLKPLLGHCMGASAALEVALLTACLEQHALPQPDYPLDPALVARDAQWRTPLSSSLSHVHPPRYILSNIFGFGGGYSSLLLEDNLHTVPPASVILPQPRFKSSRQQAPEWRTIASYDSRQGLHENWQDALAERLGQRPRRIGLGALLALHGAVHCLDSIGARPLPPHLMVRVASASLRSRESFEVLRLSREGLPLPYVFLQSQPSQTLAAFSSCLAWQGDASYLICDDLDTAQQLACLEAGNGIAEERNAPDILVGWISTYPQCVSIWRYLRRRDLAP